jgi:hypothetical protein
MAQSNQQSSQPYGDELVDIRGVQDLLTDIRVLRRTIVDAWQERAVTLTREEQRDLRDEIRSTCALLMDLTSSA